MSDEEFFRGIREDIVDTTRKMLEGATVSCEKATPTPTNDGLTVGAGSTERKNEPPPTEDPSRAESVNKMTTEFVALNIETKAQQGPEKDRPQEPKPDNDSLPLPGKPEASKRKEPKENKHKKEKKESKQTKSNDAKHREAKHRESKKQGEMHPIVNHGEPIDKLQLLTKKIKNIAAQIEGLKKECKDSPAKSKGGESAGGLKKGKEKVKDTSREKTTKHAGSTATQPPVGKTKKLSHQSTDESSGNEEPFVAEHKLLLQLFMLSSSQRRKFIEKRGIELGILDPHPVKRHVVLVSERVQPRAEDLLREAKLYMLESAAGKVSMAKPNDEVPKPVKQKRDGKGTFEEQVSFLLNDGKWPYETGYDRELVLDGIRNNANEIVQERLEAFVRELVAKSVGYMMDGMLRINARNNMQAFVDDPSRTGNIYINSVLLRRCAMEGDMVRVFVMNERRPDGADSDDGDNVPPTDDVAEPGVPKSPNNAGFVVAILEKRHNRHCVGKFLPAVVGKKHYRMFIPRDMRIPPVRIFKQDWPNALLETKPPASSSAHKGDVGDGDGGAKVRVPDVTEVLYQAEIIEWQDEVPIGTIMKSIGKCGVLEVENESILVEHCLDVTPYGEEILAQLPALPYKIPGEELARREDLRGECIFTIDPPTARDLDDALSCKLLENGNFLVGVHISDVTYFLREGSDLDELVKQRATTIYMVDAVYHMLPKPLCNTCSLLPGEDKLAFSVFWEMEPNGTVLSTRFARTVINSCSQLAYDHAQTLLDHPTGVGLDEEQFPEILHGYTVQTLCTIVNNLQSIAKHLRQRRMDDGCLKINQPKLTFRLDPETGKPIKYGVYEMRASNDMIEDFMLQANASVAQAIHTAFPSISLLRCHNAPAENMMKNLVRLLASHGHGLSYASPKDIRESMETMVRMAEHPDATQSVLAVLLAKPMIRAQYYCSEYATLPVHFMHYALAIPMYTHFTSPIRRYADCLVHRVLAATLGIDKVPERTPEELQCLATICNEKKYNAKLAGEESSMLYFRHWLAMVDEHQTDGAVMGYAAHHIEIVLIPSGIVLKAGIKRLSAVASYLYKPDESVGHCMLIPNDTSIPPFELTLFTKVRVTIKFVRDAIVVCSILPWSEATSSENNPDSTGPLLVEQPDSDLKDEVKSARVY